MGCIGPGGSRAWLDAGNRADPVAVRVSCSVMPGVQACGPIDALCDQVWRGFEVPGLHRLHLENQPVNLLEKCFAACVRHVREHRGRMLGNIRLTRLARPSPDIAIGNESKTAQIATPTRIPKVGEQIVEAQLQGRRSIHVAVQHETAA